MYFINSQVSILIYLAVFLLVAGATFRWQQSKAVERRIVRMMLTFGIDEQTARNADALLDLDMNAVRRRCRRCLSPETCERWLNGESVPGNDFCPNQCPATIFVRTRLNSRPSCRRGSAARTTHPVTGRAGASIAEAYSLLMVASSSSTG
jgi:hypothetical protein